MIVHDSRCPKFNTAQVDWTHIWWWLGGQFPDAKGSRFEKADGSVGSKLKNSPNGSLWSVHAQDEPWWSTNPLQTYPPPTMGSWSGKSLVDSRFNFGQLHGRLGSVRQLRQKLMPGPFCWDTKGQTVTIGDWLINWTDQACKINQLATMSDQSNQWIDHYSVGY